ncbi:MAG: hypothetical protein ACYDD6_10310, partial [Acidimicrobiales bacterium]
PAADARGVVASSHAQATPTPTGPALPGFEAQRAGRTRSEAAGPKIAGRAALDAAVASAGGSSRRDGGREPPRGSRPTRLTPEAPAGLSATDMTLDELAAASECHPTALAELESYGLLGGRVVGGAVYYGEDALAVARLAAGFAAFGVEARHLRIHKHAAEREAGFIEQIVLPLLKQRNPEARQRAHDTVDELSRLGQGLRAVLLRSALHDQLGG